MISQQEQFEFLISQYVDGTLNELEMRIVEDRLKTDLAARELLEEYRALNSALATHVTGPEVDFDEFRAQMRDLIADEPLPQRQPYQMFTKGYLRLAAAAVLLVVVSGGVIFWDRSQPQSGAMLITGPKIETTVSTEKSSMEIQIGPAPTMSPDERVRNAMNDTVTPRTPRIEISGAEKPRPAPSSDGKLY